MFRGSIPFMMVAVAYGTFRGLARVPGVAVNPDSRVALDPEWK
jgi:hypothetical protein